MDLSLEVAAKHSVERQQKFRPNVREIIQKYEANPSNKPTGKFLSGSGSSSLSSSSRKTSSTLIAIDVSASNFPPTTNDKGYKIKLISKETFNGQNLSRSASSIQIMSTKARPTLTEIDSASHLEVQCPNATAESNTEGGVLNGSLDKCIAANNDQGIKPCGFRKASYSDSYYQSKTLISKTNNGVRIITDILFDSNVDPSWRGSRIETDIPPSRILKEFQDKKVE